MPYTNPITIIPNPDGTFPSVVNVPDTDSPTGTVQVTLSVQDFDPATQTEAAIATLQVQQTALGQKIASETTTQQNAQATADSLKATIGIDQVNYDALGQQIADLTATLPPSPPFTPAS